MLVEDLRLALRSPRWRRVVRLLVYLGSKWDWCGGHLVPGEARGKVGRLAGAMVEVVGPRPLVTSLPLHRRLTKTCTHASLCSSLIPPPPSQVEVGVLCAKGSQLVS
jgi:hypothetical protein